MLRIVVLLLVLLNGLYYAWGHGWLQDYGWGPAPQREPQRLAQQLRPEDITILNEKELAKLVQALEAKAKARANPPVCLVSEVLDTVQVKTMQEVLKNALPDDAWTLEAVPIAEQWIIYMGKYTNRADLAKKRGQLDTLKLPYEVLSDAALAPGFSLGRFESSTAAAATLETMVARGVRTAKVLQVRSAGQGVRLRLPALDETLIDRLPPVRAALGGQALVPCTGN
jgi:hypothetical protein